MINTHALRFVAKAENIRLRSVSLASEIHSLNVCHLNTHGRSPWRCNCQIYAVVCNILSVHLHQSIRFQVCLRSDIQVIRYYGLSSDCCQIRLLLREKTFCIKRRKPYYFIIRRRYRSQLFAFAEQPKEIKESLRFFMFDSKISISMR